MLLGAGGGLAALVGVGEGLRQLGVEQVQTRRLVHAGVGLFVAATPLLFSSPLPVYVLAGLFVGGNGYAKSRHWWPGIHAARPESWGTVTMPLAAIIGMAATWSVSPDRILIFQVAFLIVAVSDPLASWVGQRWGRRTLLPNATLRGSGTFLVTAVCVSGGFLLLRAEGPLDRVARTALLLGGIATAVEMIGQRGWDNLFVVLAVVLVMTPLQADPSAATELFYAAGAGGAFGGLAYWTRTLTPTGAVGGGLFAASLVGIGGWTWALPAFVFFGGSSGLSVLRRTDAAGERRETEQSGRSLVQVLANGGVAWGLLALHEVVPAEASEVRAVCYVGFLGALAAAAADTWATEIGTRVAAPSWSLRTGEPVVAGTSGAVSVPGTAAAVLGAGSVAGTALLLGNGPTVLVAGKVIVAGVVGMGADSLAGATIQVRFRPPDAETTTERPLEEGATLVRGWRGMNNDAVNLLCTGAGAVSAMLL